MTSDSKRGEFYLKAKALASGLFVLSSLGVAIETVRHYTYSHVAVNITLERLPALSRFLLILPSSELHTQHRVYLMLFVSPWILMLYKSANLSAVRLWTTFFTVSSIAFAFAWLLATAMIYPCIPRMTMLPPDDLPSSYLANGIALLFYSALAAALLKFLFIIRGKPTK